MRRLTAFASLALAACTMQQQNGDLRVTPSPIFGGQHWEVTQQTADKASRVCTVFAGELDVTQRAEGKHIARQVALSSALNPGNRYRILVNGHRYETVEAQFSSQDSAAIIADLLTSDVAYTELQEREVAGLANPWRRASNKIPLAEFASMYKECERFVSGHKKK